MIRVMNWNIEHMNSWWTGGSEPILRETYAGSSFSPAITDVPDLAQRVAAVIRDVDPDVVTLQEAAGAPELTEFFDTMVGRGPWSIERGSGGAQALAVAARTDRGIAALAQAPPHHGTIDLSVDLMADVDADLLVNPQAFARVPQVVALTTHDGESILVVNNHLKSKFVANAEAMWRADGNDRLAFIRSALIARRRISAEAYRIRQFLDSVLDEQPDRHVIVTGDLNDGAGSDYFEETYLTHSVVDRIFGSVFHPDRHLTHVLFHGDAFDWTARFYDFILEQMNDLVLDHIGLSPSLATHSWAGRVASLEYDTYSLCDSAASDRAERDRLPSDHRPVVVDIE